MNLNKSNSQLPVDGKMTSKGADKVGFMQALALIILALSALVLSVSALILALK